MAIKRQIWAILLASMSVLGLAGTPASARVYPAGAPDLAPAAQPHLFWYVPSLETAYHSLPLTSLAFNPADPGVALAANSAPGGDLLRTTDHGLTWARLASWNPSDTRYGFRVIPGGTPHTYYAWGGVQIYKTVDNGDTWTQIPYNTSCNQIVTMTVHPTNPPVLYVGTTNGFAWSLDGGQTWGASNSVFCSGGPHAFAIGVGVDQPNILYAGEFYNYGGGVYRSTDNGLTWENRSTGLPIEGGFLPSIIRVLVDPQNTDIVYVLTEQGQIYRTTNAGGQWNLFDQGIQSLQMTDLVLDSAHGNAIYAATFDHLYILANSTQSWQMLDTDPIPQIPSLPSKVSLRIDPTLPYRPVPFTESGALIGLPIPTITKLSPDTAPAGTRSFTLTVDGSDFTPVARVRWNGQDRPTTFVSDTRLTAAISATDVLTPSVVPIAVGYRRFSSATSDGASNTLPFMIQPACAVNGLAVASEQCAVSVTPGMPATLVYTSSSSLVTSISVPSGSVTETTVLGYTAVTTATAPAGFGFAGLAFTLDAYRNDSKLAGFVFTQPIVITVHYGDDDIAGLNEKTLTLDYWSGTTWVDAATTCSPSSLYQRELNANRFSVAVCHLTPFGVFGVSERKLFLPFLHR